MTRPYRVYDADGTGELRKSFYLKFEIAPSIEAFGDTILRSGRSGENRFIVLVHQLWDYAALLQALWPLISQK